MQEGLSEILDNILGLLLLEGSYDIEEDTDGLHVSIETADAGRLIGFNGESLSALQLLVNQMMTRSVQSDRFKRVILDVGGWRRSKEVEFEEKTRQWAAQVKDSDQVIELEPMPSWQRRIVHMTIQEIEGVESESIGQGQDRHLVIRAVNRK